MFVRTDEWQLSVGVVNGVPGPAGPEMSHPGSGQSDGGSGQSDGGSGQSDGGHLGAGFGLKGMRERVEALHGTLHVGPTAAGGFEVLATLPAS